MIKDNVVFHKISDVTVTRSKWIVTFVIDLEPYENFIHQIKDRIDEVTRITKQVLANYQDTRKAVFFKAFSQLTSEIKSLLETHTILKVNLQDFETLQVRDKRSLLPFIGSAASFLFGLASEEDLESIRSGVRNLAKNQAGISHVLETSLTLLNVSRVQISENRQTLNTLIGNMGELDTHLKSLASYMDKQVFEITAFLRVYLQIDLAMEEIKLMIQGAILYSEQLKLQLNMLSLGRLSPSVITPTNLRSLLTEISNHIPPSVTLPSDIDKNLWHYYETLTCSTVLDGNTILIIISIPLLDYSSKFEIFHMIHLPIPLQNTSDSSLVAQYRLESDTLAVNHERTKYVLLSAQEFMSCSQNYVSYCEIRSPVYPINLSKLCIIALFLDDTMKKQQICQSMVKPNFILPMAQYVSNGLWIVTTQFEIRFTITCYNATLLGSTSQDITAPVGLIELGQSCSASSDYITLTPYYRGVSKYIATDEIKALFNGYDSSNMQVWQPFLAAMPNYSGTALPSELKGMTEIPMNHLIEKLRNLEEVTMIDPWPFWVYMLIGGGILLGIILLLWFWWTFRIQIKTMITSARGKYWGHAKVTEEQPVSGQTTEPRYNGTGEEIAEPVQYLGNSQSPSTTLAMETRLYPTLKG
jgi:hypothetical protein